MLNSYFIIMSSEALFFFAIILFFIHGLINKQRLLYHEFVDLCFWDATIILIFTLARILQTEILNLYVCNNAFLINPFISFTEVVCLIIILLLFWGSYDYFITTLFPIYEFTFLSFFCVFGLFLLLKSNNLFVLYLSIEVQSIALYVLIALRPASIYSIEAGLKYYIFSVFLTLTLLFGISLLYSELGTLNCIDLALILSNCDSESVSIKLGFLLIMFGLLIKLAIFPFHGWIADVYLGTNLVSACFLAIIPKIIFLVTIVKILFLFPFLKIQLLLGLLGVCSVIMGTVIGLYQTKLLRVLAFSAIVNMGYILISISLQTVDGLVAGFYSMFIYSFVMLGIFIILLTYRTPLGWELKFISDLCEMLKGSKLLTFFFVTLILSLAGLPPFAGFCGKFFIFLAIIKQGEYFYAFILFFASIATAVYYLRLIRFLYFSEHLGFINIQPIQISEGVAITLIVIVIMNLFLVAFQAPLILLLFNLIIDTFFLSK